MALVLKDRVKESSSSSGTGSITLSGAIVGYQTFASVVASGSTVYYTIHNLTTPYDNEWEVGVGTFTSPSTLARTTVLSSSNSGSLVPFTAGASGLEVFITQPAEEAVYLNQATGLVEIGGNGTNTVSFTNINASNVVMVSGTISTNAANATDITNKTYVDGLFSTGISYHDPVLVEEDVALNAVYVQPNGAANGVGATLTNNGSNVALVVDGVSVSNTARILVYAQANAVQNGVYTVTNPGNASAQWVLTRATDADTFGLANPNQLGQGDAFFVQDGDTGAGRTYICNTPGTITFGSTNITFAQISSAQIYAAGTGLNLSNLTFSIANTTVVSGLYGDSATVPVIEVNAQGQLTSAANSAINVSNITVGTLPNARTTADSANGASTIVLRDANGSFNANVVTATTVNATTGNFTNITANASGLTDINASNISSGTISNARTTGDTANSANTIVLRDATGSFGSNVITASLFSGDGSGINAINASNISSGTVANARTTAASANGASTIVLRDSSGSFSAGDITASSISGNGIALTAINASNIASGTIANARTTANSSNGASTIVLRGSSGEFAAGDIVGASANIAGNAFLAVSSGNVGVGLASPAAKLDILGPDAVVGNGYLSKGLQFAPSNFSTRTWSFNYDDSGTAGNGFNISSTSTKILYLNANGNMGLGTVNPSGKLHISGGVNTYQRISNTTNSVNLDIVAGSAVGAIGTSTNHPFTTVTNDTERMRVNAAGGVSIGTTTDSGNTNLLVAGTVTGSSFIASSDERLKENWTGLSADFIEKLSQVKNGSFNRIGNDTRESGVTAQSLQKVMPEAVVEGADGYLSVNYGGAALVAAIELAKVVEELRKEVAELRAELKAK
jgi:hypothetical protein